MRAALRRDVPKAPSCRDCPAFRSGLFGTISEAGLSALDRLRTRCSIKKGQLLISEEMPCLGVYCIRSGSIKMYHSGHGGRQPIEEVAGPGDMIGLAPLFAGVPSTLAAEAVEPAEACFLPRERFLQLLQSEPKLMQGVVRFLAGWVLRLEEELLSLADMPAHARLARLLLAWDETCCAQQAGRAGFCVPYSRQDMADMAHVTAETVSRILGRFRKAGLLEIRGRRMRVLDRVKLARTACAGLPAARG